VGAAEPEHKKHQRRRVTAHELAAAVHDRAAKMHQYAAEFFDEHDESGKADRERDLSDREAQHAEADRGIAAELADPPSDPYYPPGSGLVQPSS